jgi:CheY-like chemotaxis protein
LSQVKCHSFFICINYDGGLFSEPVGAAWHQSCFCFRLNLPQMPKPPYILLADDDPEDREMLIDLLRERLAETEVRTVNNGREAMEWLLECAGNELPALIVLDYKMPELTGAEVLKATAQHALFRLIPKVVWSTSSNSEYIEICVRHGALKYFTKPTDMAGLAFIADCIRELFLRTVSARPILHM